MQAVGREGVGQGGDIDIGARTGHVRDCLSEPPGSASTGRRELVAQVPTGCRRAATNPCVAVGMSTAVAPRNGSRACAAPSHEDAGSTTGSPRTRRFWEPHGQRDRAQEPDPLDLRREHRLQRSGCCGRSSCSTSATPGSSCRSPSSSGSPRVPNLVGSTLRIPYTFAVPRFGGRLWTAISASLLLIPCMLLAVVVPSGWLAGPGSRHPVLVLLGCAATAGFGGGNFSSSMANISFFYPEGKQGAGARPQRRRRQPRRGDRPAARAARDHHRRARRGREAARARGPPRLRRPDVDAVHRRRRDRRLAVHGQPHAGEGRHALLRPGARPRPDLGHVGALHRHVRLVHRLLVRAAAGHQEHVPGVPRRSTRSSRPTSPGSASWAR